MVWVAHGRDNKVAPAVGRDTAERCDGGGSANAGAGTTSSGCSTGALLAQAPRRTRRADSCDQKNGVHDQEKLESTPRPHSSLFYSLSSQSQAKDVE